MRLISVNLVVLNNSYWFVAPSEVRFATSRTCMLAPVTKLFDASGLNDENSSNGPAIISINANNPPQPNKALLNPGIGCPRGCAKYPLLDHLAINKSAYMFSNLIHWKRSKAVFVNVQSETIFSSKMKGAAKNPWKTPLLIGP